MAQKNQPSFPNQFPWKWLGVLYPHQSVGNQRPTDDTTASASPDQQPQGVINMAIGMSFSNSNDAETKTSPRSDSQIARELNDVVITRYLNKSQPKTTKRERLATLTGPQLREIILAACLQNSEIRCRVTRWVNAKQAEHKPKTCYDQLGLSLQNLDHPTLVNLVIYVGEKDETHSTQALLHQMVCRFESTNIIQKNSF